MTDKALEAALLPCPFCGSEPECLSVPGGMWVRCPACKALSDDRTAIAAWNRRAPLSALPGEAEVVAWRYHSGAKGAKWTVQKNHPAEVAKWSGYTVEALVTLASLQAMQARAEKAERERDEAVGKWEAADGMDGAVVHAIRELLNAQNVPLNAFIDDHVANAIHQRNAAEARVKELKEERDALRSRIEEQRVNFAGLQAVQDALDLILPPAKGGSNG